MEKKENKVVVSFCIATFQRYDILIELIQEILSVDSDKIEVVVCDDHSLDDSMEKIRQIQDSRLKMFINEENVGSLLNIYEALNKGEGEYVFYVNDRDNVDSFKIKTLVEILECLRKDNVGFARCVPEYGKEKYSLFKEGEEALMEFACRMDHPTGFIFKRELWHKIKNRKRLFENQNYGDYVITQICAILARDYKGAVIYGDICDIRRLRIDFSVEKSGYYRKRKDKRLWYCPEVIYRELKVGQRFLEKIGVAEHIRTRILIDRYTRYLPWLVTSYKFLIVDPGCTSHYDFYPKQDFVHVFMKSMLSGLKLWHNAKKLCVFNANQGGTAIDRVTKKEYRTWIRNIFEDNFLFETKWIGNGKERRVEIYKREAVLNTYERWVDKLILEKKVSKFLVENGYSRVAIYGMGRIGKHLLAELKCFDVNVVYLIDQRISKCMKYYKETPCYSMDNELPYADMIIVTVPSESEKIKAELNKRFSYKVESINDILFVL